MATLTISLSDEEMRRLEVLGKREGLTVEQMVRLGIHDFIGQPDDAFHAAAKRVMEKNAELYAASHSPATYQPTITPYSTAPARRSSGLAKFFHMPAKGWAGLPVWCLRAS